MYDLDWLCFARLFGLALIACAYPVSRNPASLFQSSRRRPSISTE